MRTRKNNRWSTQLVFATFMIGLQTVGVRYMKAQAAPPAVRTDRNSYLAGATVTITGSGFAPNESVSLSVTHNDGSRVSGHRPSSVIANVSGTFTGTWSIDLSDPGPNDFIVTASGNVTAAHPAASFSRMATIMTDKFDYIPGQTATISGAGFRPRETVTLQVSHVNGVNNDAADHQPFNTVADSNGAVSAPWYVDQDNRDTILSLTALGNASGLKANSIFVDAFVFINDTSGADDEPGQKDLSRLGKDLTNENGATPSIAVLWQWDDTGWSGGNTGDACALFDTDNDTFINYAVCVEVHNDPAVENIDASGNRLAELYSCGNSKVDRCTTPNAVLKTNLPTDPTPTPPPGEPIQTLTNCQVAVVDNIDPFHSTNTGSQTRADTVATCGIVLSDISNAKPNLVNVCSYPSAQVNSDPSDCIIPAADGNLIIQKIDQSDNSTVFTFTSNRASAVEGSTFTITGSGTHTPIQFSPTPLSLTETQLAGWKTAAASCTRNDGSSTGAVDLASGTITGIVIDDGLPTTCTFTNRLLSAKLTVQKVVINHGGNKSSADFAPYKINTTTVTLGASNTLTPGTYTVSEATDPNYTATFSGACNGTSSVTLADGDDVTCTITNEEKLAHITVNKVVINHGLSFDKAHFVPYTVGATTVVEGQSTQIPSGTYTVGEKTDANYTATFSGDCDANGSVTVTSGSNKSCTITNEEVPAHLTVNKVCAPTSDGGKFNLLINGQTVVADAACGTGTGSLLVDTGSYTVGESAGSNLVDLSGYAESISCRINGGTGTEIAAASNPFGPLPNPGTVNVPVNSNDAIVCTISNSKLATMPVTKFVNGQEPNDGNGTVTVDSDGVTVHGTNFVPGSSWNNTDIKIGNLLFHIAATPSVTATQLTLVSPGTGGSLASTAYVHMTSPYYLFNLYQNPGGTKSFNFTTTPFGSLNLGFADPSFPAQTGGDTASLCEIGLTSAPSPNGSIAATSAQNLPFGAYAIQPGWQELWTTSATGATIGSPYIGLTDGTHNLGCVDISGITFGAQLHVDVNNVPPGHIKILKNSVGGNGTFNFTVGSGPAGTPLAPKYISNSNPSLTTPNASGVTVDVRANNGNGDTAYTLTETSQTGWAFNTVSCSDDNGTPGDSSDDTTVVPSQTNPLVSLTVAPIHTVTCTYTNTKQASITIIKHAVGGDSTFSFTTTGGAPLADFNITTSGGNGQKQFLNNVVLGTTYTVTESIPPAGWDFTSLTCVVTGAGSTHSEAGAVATLNLAAGGNATCTYTNTGHGNLHINKTTIGGDNTFGYTVTGPTSSTRNITTVNGTGTTGDFTVTAGSYTITESTVPSGWAFVLLKCTVSGTGDSTATQNGSTKVANINLKVGDTVTCTYTNAKLLPGYTITQGGYGSTPNGGNPGAILLANFATVYPSAVTIGKTLYNCATFDSAAAIQAYLPEGGTPGTLPPAKSCVIDPTRSKGGAGVFAGQVLALQLSVDFSNANVKNYVHAFPTYHLTGGTIWDGLTVQAALFDANIILGGGSVTINSVLYNSKNISAVNGLIDQLNQSFDGGVEDTWALLHLIK